MYYPLIPTMHMHIAYTSNFFHSRRHKTEYIYSHQTYTTKVCKHITCANIHINTHMNTHKHRYLKHTLHIHKHTIYTPNIFTYTCTQNSHILHSHMHKTNVQRCKYSGVIPEGLLDRVPRTIFYLNILLKKCIAWSK